MGALHRRFHICRYVGKRANVDVGEMSKYCRNGADGARALNLYQSGAGGEIPPRTHSF